MPGRGRGRLTLPRSNLVVSQHHNDTPTGGNGTRAAPTPNGRHATMPPSGGRGGIVMARAYARIAESPGEVLPRKTTEPTLLAYGSVQLTSCRSSGRTSR